MANNGLDIAPPPARRTPPVSTKPIKAGTPAKFKKQAESEMVQFNKRITRGTADSYEILAIKTRKKIPELLAEGLEFLQEKYGKT